MILRMGRAPAPRNAQKLATNNAVSWAAWMVTGKNPGGHGESLKAEQTRFTVNEPGATLKTRVPANGTFANELGDRTCAYR